MEGTDRYWSVLGVSIVLAAGALVVSRPLLVAGAVSLWIWLIGAQIGFARRVQTVSDQLQLTHELETAATTAGTTVAVSLAATLSTPTAERVTIHGRPPVSATATSHADRTLTLTPGTTAADTTYTMTLPATGQVDLRGIRCTVHDRLGLFSDTFTRTPSGQTAVEVSPYGPDQIQIGRGTQSIGRGYGEHEATRGGGGIDPRELRQYVPGDSVADIDWNATARLPETYVREYEAAMTQQTLIVFDMRAEMHRGPAERTMLTHARRIGHGIVRTTQQQADPLGWLAVDDGGVAAFSQPQSTPTQYRRAKQFVDTVGVRSQPPASSPSGPSPTDTDHTGPGAHSVAEAEHPQHTAGNGQVDSMTTRVSSHRGAAAGLTTQYQPATQTLADRQQIATQFAAADTAFATQLQPFFAATGGYMEAIDTDSLFHSLRVGRQRIPGTLWTVLISSDNRRSELFEAVRMASRGDNRVAVFVTPEVLFSETIETDPEAAYEQYQSFQEFRTRLDRHPSVQAFEVGPQDRIADILDSQPTGGRPQ